MDDRRKRLLYLSQHRGTKEADLVLGGFAVHSLEGMTEQQLEEFETLSNLPDQDLLEWCYGIKAIPDEHQSETLDLFLRYVRDDHAS